MQYVVPFSTPQYNWAVLQSIYKEFGKTAPTRIIENKGIKLTQPVAFMAAFQERNTGWVESFISISFLIHVPTSMTITFEELLHVISFHTLLDRDYGDSVLLGMGTLKDWDIAVNLLCNNPRSIFKDIGKELKACIRKYHV